MHRLAKALAPTRFVNALSLRQDRLDILYVVLAGLNLVTLGAVLLLNHATLTAFQEGADTSRLWSARQSRIIELASRARAVDAPPNDVFETRDPEAERRRLEAAAHQFDVQMSSVIGDFQAHRISHRDDEILAQITRAQLQMQGLLEVAHATLDNFAAGRETQASRDMVLTDRAFSQLMARLEAASAMVERERSENLDAQLASAHGMQGLELSFAIAVFFVMAIVVAVAVQVAALVRRNTIEQQRMLGELADTRDRLRQYADDVSHELRLPISRMRLEAELMLNQPRSPEHYRSGIEGILAQCNELSTMTEGLLFIARAENTKVALRSEWLDLERELGLLADYFAAPADDAGIELCVVGAKGRVWADRTLLQRALSNLITNVLTHAPRGSCVKLQARQSAGSTIIEVEDNGPGVPAHLLAHLFTRFQRGDGAQAGSGLGLAIVKSIMDMHGGKVELASANGFRVELTFPHTEEPASTTLTRVSAE
ncbi:ATP-binding protein [Candidatus Viadribacter manganicus]|nr:ATP-binding protein [Candidatus Viadribacter manganicus]